MEIKNYSYSLWGDILEIYITDLNDCEFILATLHDCKDLTDSEIHNLIQEIIEENGYILI